VALKKAAVWALIAGLCHLIAPEFGPGFYPSWYFALNAVAFGLMLPAIASLHVRHLLVRQSGAMLGTITGVSVVALGAVAASDDALLPAALFVSGMWWWTIGKMWAETQVMPRALGWFTMALAFWCFVYAGAGLFASVPELPLRLFLGVWLIFLAVIFWRDAR
jgi:hypothetical protein